MAKLFFWKKKIELPDVLPSHIAFIMDGNRRWAKRRSLPGNAGHSAGASVFKKIIEYCFESGIETVTVYAFSTENWKRSEDEISSILKLLDEYLNDFLESGKEKNIRIRFLGDQSNFDLNLIERIKKAQDITKNNKYNLNVALNYGGRSELCHAFKILMEKGISSPTEQDISSALYTSETGDPDLIVRTGGEQRLSNFLLWQSAYSELYFTNTLWPDFNKNEVAEILRRYAKTQRRFGGK